jgi:hypothetical protein
MLNWVRPCAFDRERGVNAALALLRYYLGDWSAAKVAAHAEYVYWRAGMDHTDDEHQLAFLLDVDS